jgi:cytidylate kinase
MEGRDIGSVVFPAADVKIFLDAQTGERVHRRYLEDAAKGKPVTEESLAAQIRERDQRDSTRAEAPLTQAPDALYVDSTELSIDQVEDAILQLVRARISNGKDFH